MKILILKILAASIWLGLMAYGNLFVFRSMYPALVILSLTMTVACLIVFPYKHFFTINKNNNEKSI